MADTFTIYHNPRCSKSRQTLALLEEHGVEPEVVLYLQAPLNANKLKELAKSMGKGPREFIRKGEADYKTLNLGDADKTDQDLYNAMATHPKLIERPIVVKGKKAVLGRPPENVLTLING